MNVNIIKIGKSQGIKIPKNILDIYKIKDSVDLVFENEQIIIRPAHQKRAGWEEKFKNFSETQNNEIFIDEIFEDEDFEEWN